VDHWHLTRRGSSLRVDVQSAVVLGHEADAILEAVEAAASTNNFDAIHVTGTILEQPPTGTRHLLRRINDVAGHHGKRLDVGPI
jgi:hypothetical protein